MKIALITDQHLDGRKGSLAFWNYFQKFYDEIFFPTLEKEGVKVIFDLGDTFDNRKSMDYNTFNRVDSNYFQRLKIDRKNQPKRISQQQPHRLQLPGSPE